MSSSSSSPGDDEALLASMQVSEELVTAPAGAPGAVAGSLARGYEPAPANFWRVGTLVYTSGGLVALFCWLLFGDFAWSLKDKSVGPFMQLMLKRFHASDTTVGLFMGALPAAIAVLLCPIISYRSDRHRGRWGRRIPYLLVATPTAALALAALAFSPALGGSLHRTLGSISVGLDRAVVLLFGTFWTIFEFGTIVSTPLLAGLINDVVPTPFIGRFYGLFRILAQVAGLSFNYFLLGKVEAHYISVFVGISVLYGGSFILMCLNVKEGEYPPPPAGSAGPSGISGSIRMLVTATKAYAQECFAHPYYLWLFIGITMATLSALPVNMFNVIFAKSLKMNMDYYGKVLMGLNFTIGMALSYPLGWLADRYHPLRVGMATMLIYALATLWAGFYAVNSRNFGIATVLHMTLSGTILTATASLPQRLFPGSKFGQFAAASQAVLSLSTFVLALVVGPLLDYTHHVYRYTYLTASVLTIAGLVTLWVVYRQFITLGGPKHYVAPGSEQPEVAAEGPFV